VRIEQLDCDRPLYRVCMNGSGFDVQGSTGMWHEAQKMKLPSSFDGITLKPCGMLPTWKSNKKSSAEIRASPIFPQCAHLTTSSQQSRAIPVMRNGLSIVPLTHEIVSPCAPIEIRPEFGALDAASLTGEQGL